jgi:hypothetical protein
MLQYFNTQDTDRFARELAKELMSELGSSIDKKDAKFAVKAEKVLINADRRVQQFKASQKMNFYKRSKLANTFLWTLKDVGCPGDYAKQLTEWLTYRL